MKKINKLFFFALIFFTAIANAENSVWGLPQLMRAMSQINESKVAFTEKKTMSILSEPLISSGKLYYVRPDRIERHVVQPKEDRWIVEGDTLITMQGKKQRKIKISDYSVAQAFIESIRATLAGDQKALEHFYQITFTGNEKSWVLFLKPIDSQMLQYVESVKISGTSTQINTIETLEINGDKSLMTIKREVP